MQSLFFKILIWFWIAIVLVLAAFILSIAVTQTEPVYAAWREAMTQATAIYAQSAAEVYERDGKEALSDYFGRIERSVQLHPLLFDEAGHEVLGKPAPPRLTELIARARASGSREFLLGRIEVFIAQPTATPTNRRFVLVVQTTRTFPFGDRASLRQHFLRWGFILLTAGALCFWLARYLTNPVAQLSAAARLFANGNLSVRVGSAFGKRRDELADLGHDFDQMAERIESLVSAQRRLLSDISHELRSHLARLSVALELARQRSGGDARSVLDRIEREAGRLNVMIGHLLTLSRLETGTQTLERQPIELAHLIEEIVEDADFEARSRKRSVRIGSVQPCTVNGNEGLLRSAIENIVRNAVRYTPENSEVILTLEQDESVRQARVIVRDYGVGVPVESLHRIFQPFYRVAYARERQTGGVGLGLAITQRAATWHSGEVTAENADDGGLIVRLRLPLAADNEG
jgi:signal transduction histidine kinase